MFSKLQFNNLVITHKKNILQAKNQTINKLVRKVRQLKSLLEKRPEDAKNKERLRKTQENIEQLKKLKCDDLMRKILLLDVKPTAIITNGQRATPEEVIIAMLAINKIMQDLNKKFREVLNLEENDATWKEQILETSKRRLKIERTNEKRRKRKELKEQKAMERNRNEWIKENRPKPFEADIDLGCKNEDDAIGKLKTRSGVWKDEPLAEDEKVNLMEKANVIKVSKIDKKVLRKTCTEKLPALVKTTKTIQKNQKQFEEEYNHHDETKAKQVKLSKNKVKRLELENEADFKLKFEYASEEENESKITHVEDPFFLTDSGERYLSTAVVNRGDDSEKPSAIRPTGREFRSERKTHNNVHTATEYGEFKQLKRSYNDGYDRKVNVKNAISNKSNINARHPSWEAKEKQKPVIRVFEGKRKIIGDDEQAAPKTIKANIKMIDQNVAQLHPSWAAKQKQKPTITAFQGKKITFDNDD